MHNDDDHDQRSYFGYIRVDFSVFRWIRSPRLKWISFVYGGRGNGGSVDFAE